MNYPRLQKHQLTAKAYAVLVETVNYPRIHINQLIEIHEVLMINVQRINNLFGIDLKIEVNQ